MQDKVKDVYSATGLCKTIKDFDGNCISITEQKDIDEFYYFS